MTYSMGFTKEFPPNNKIIKQVTCGGTRAGALVCFTKYGSRLPFQSRGDSIQLPSFVNNIFFFVFCSPVE